jgi:hypothetical protein
MHAIERREKGVSEKIYIIAGRIIICGPALPRNGRGGQTRRRCLSAKFIDQRVGSTERDSNGKDGVKAQLTSVVLRSDIEILVG